MKIGVIFVIKKSIMAKSLTMLTFFGGIKTKAFVYFPEYLGRNIHGGPCRLLDENQNIDEKNIIKKCIEINKELIKLVDRFTDYQNTVKKIINQIRIWFDEIQKSKRFEEISKTKEFKEKMDKYDEDEFFEKKITRDLVYNFYTLLPEDERKEFDKKAEEFRNKLLDILKNEEKKFNGCGERFTELTSNFDSLIKTLKFEEYNEKTAKDTYEKFHCINLNLIEKKKILSFMLSRTGIGNHETISFMLSRTGIGNHETRRDIREGHGCKYTVYGYDFKNPTLLIDEFKEFLKNVNLHKQYVEINDLKYSFPLNINNLMRGQNKISELKIQVYIFNQRQKLMNDDKNYINDTNKDFEFLLQNL